MNIENQITSYYEYLLNFAKFRLCNGNHQNALDLTQDTIYRALIKTHLFQEGTSLKSWLITIMRNLFINEYRKKNTSPIYDPEEKDYLISNLSSHSVGNRGEDTMMIEFIDDKITQLPIKQKTLFELRNKGYSYEEMMKMEKIPLGTVKIRIHQARKKLKQQLINHI